ncbi:MAG: VWA domain-containing protein [Bacteroidia bacterium]|nr:VWA domain-containing protein [Bacteroidia bacterium]
MKFRIPDLRLLSLGYLGIPMLIFWWGWCHTWWALGLSLLLFWGMSSMAKNRHSFVIGAYELLGMAILALLLAYLSGMGGFIPQQDDYLKHNQLWQDLVKFAWPIGYEYQGDVFALSYYLAYYLPPALLAKLFGQSSLGFFSFIWGYLGVLIVFCWLSKLLGRRTILLILIFCLFGGQDMLWRFLVELRYFWVEGHWGEWHWDEMGLPYEPGLGHKLPTHFGALCWAPQHFLPGVLAGAMILEESESKMASTSLPLVQALCLLWSPFVAIGMGLFVLQALWKRKKYYLNHFWQLIPALLIGIFSAIFFLAHGELGEKGWIWTQSQDSNWPFYLVFFAMMKFLPLLGLLIWRNRLNASDKNLLGLGTATLILTMFYWMGHANDLYMRATLPAWFMLSVFLARELVDFEYRNVRKWLLLLCFVGGSLVPISKIWNHSMAALGRGEGFANTASDKEKVFIQIKEVYTERGLIGKDKLWDQYVGDPDALFFRFVSKPINVVSSSKNENLER